MGHGQASALAERPLSVSAPRLNGYPPTGGATFPRKATMAQPPNPLDQLDTGTRDALERRFADCPSIQRPSHQTLEACARDVLRVRARAAARVLQLPAHVWPNGRIPR
jgi:hypothetical protein